MPAFDALLRGDVAPQGVEPLTKDSLQTVFVHATRSLAAERPTIVLIEDLHFAPEEGRALFASLALAVPGHRVLLVATMRPGVPAEWRTQLERLGHTQRLELPRLGAKDLVRLLAETLRSEHLATELAGLIALKSDGNPFFVFEMLRGLKEGQFLAQREDGTWHTTQVLREIQVPSSITDLVNARVADLAEEERDLLDVASCCGFEFDAALVADAVGVAPVVAFKRLAQIERRHRLAHASGRRFVFDHHQVQEALYGALPEPLRESYHAAIADALERRSDAASKDPKDLDGALCVDIAEHLLKGAQGSRALRYLDPALTHLEAGSMNDQAITLADRALSTPALLTGKERADVLLRKAGRLDLLGRREPERAALDEALALAEADGESALQARVELHLGWQLIGVARYDEAAEVLGRAREHAEAAGETKLAAHATGHLGIAFREQGRYEEARGQHERHIELAREISDRRGEANATGNLGIVFRVQGRFEEARGQHERHIELAREISDRRGEATATGNLGIVSCEQGRYEEARGQHERHLELAREIGDRQGEANATGNLGNVFQSQGRHEEARGRYERHLELAREIGDRLGEACATGNLGSVFCEQGRYEEARGQSERCLELYREIGDRSGEAHALGCRGLLWLSLGDRGQARKALEQSLGLLREVGSRYQGYALRHLAFLADEEGDPAGSLRLAQQSLALHREIGHADGVASSLKAIAELRRRAGDAEGARAALAEALTLSIAQGQAGAVAQVQAMLATLPGGDARTAREALAESGEQLAASQRMEAHHLLFEARGDPGDLAEAKRILDFLVEHAPPAYRASMISNVRLHREIAAAAREAGL